MASKPLRFHPQAEQEYLTALNWYRERSLTAAISFEAGFAKAVVRIREAPQRWPIYFKDFRKIYPPTISLQHCVSRLFF
jgi:hypothetical protein